MNIGSGLDSDGDGCGDCDGWVEEADPAPRWPDDISVSGVHPRCLPARFHLQRDLHLHGECLEVGILDTWVGAPHMRATNICVASYTGRRVQTRGASQLSNTPR